MCAVLRGEAPAWPGADARLVTSFLNRSQYHGVQALLYERLHAAADWPPEVIEALRQPALAGTMWELRHQRVVAEMLEAMVGIGVEPVLFKGTALAYSLYANPAFRTRGDTDLIVPAQERKRVLDVLGALGFYGEAHAGDLISHQASLTRDMAGGGSHTIDLHWKINDSALLSRLFSYEELRQSAQPLPALAPHALGAGPVHALLIACMHRAGHKQAPYFVDGVAHFSGDRLIWLYDIHLLAQALSAPQWEEFLTLAGRKGLRAVCLEGIEHTRSRLATPVPPEVLAELARPGAPEPVAEYLNASHLRRRWLEILAHEGAAARLHFVRQLAFPPAAYMRARFAGVRPGWLPWLYVLRAVGGLRRRVDPHG